MADARDITALCEQGRARLILRLPDHRYVIAESSDTSFLDLCESYALAWSAIDHWAGSTAAEADKRRGEYNELAEALEEEVIGLIPPYGRGDG